MTTAFLLKSALAILTSCRWPFEKLAPPLATLVSNESIPPPTLPGPGRFATPDPSGAIEPLRVFVPLSSPESAIGDKSLPENRRRLVGIGLAMPL